MLSPPFIDMRVKAVGGSVRDTPIIRMAGLEVGRRTVLLIHGFNTTRLEAEDGYDAFRTLLRRSAPRVAERLCPVYWPGDSHLKAGGYPWLVDRAALCGAKLADWLEHQEHEVVIVAHSLGCRLALEALGQLAERQRGPEIRLFLMAAAVPVGLMAQENHLRRALDRANSVDVLHSGSDGVLAFWFRLGQSFAPGESDVLPEAVGLRGQPGESIWTRSAEMPGYQHGEYWIGTRMASHLAHRLGAAVPKPRPIRLTGRARLFPERPSPQDRPNIAPRRMRLRR